MMKPLTFFTLVLIFFSFTVSAFSQNENGSIKGIIVDATNDEVLTGANVIIDGTSIGTATGLDGEFIFPSVKAGEYILDVSYIGYKDKQKKVIVHPGEDLKVIIKLEWSAVEGEAIQVTAQASGQLGAINEQLSAVELKNVVSKDQIRELPNQNAAESVGRLPGVSLLRSGGEGNKVVIRGLQPKYALVMVDGVAMAPTSSSDRSMSMSMISSYSLEGIEVIKSPTANMDGDQVAGAVNFTMRTAKDGFNYEVVAQGGYNELRDSFSDYMFLGGVSNRWLDSKLGVYFQLNTDRKNMASNSMNAGYSIYGNDVEKPDYMFPLAIGSVSLTNTFRIRTRYSGTLTLDYLIPNGKIYLKNFLSSGANNTQNYGEYFGTSHTCRTSDEETKQLIFSSIFGYEQYLSIFKVNSKLSYSYSGSETPYSNSFSFYGLDMASSIDKDERPEDVPLHARNEYETFYWNGISGGDSKTSGSQIMASLDFETNFSLSSQLNGKVKFGGKFRYDDHSYDYNGFVGNPALASGTAYKNALINGIPRLSHLPLNTTSKFYYSDFYDKDFSHGSFLKGAYTLGPVADTELMRDIYNIWDAMFAESDVVEGTYHVNAKSSVINDYSGFERLGAGYLMFDLDLGKKVKFIPGVRYEAKNTQYDGINGKDGSFPDRHYDKYNNYVDTTSIRNNDFWLPMIHLRYEPFDWMQVRLAYTHTIARPSYRNIIPTLDIMDQSINMRNPFLRPELAKSYDLYFAFSENYLGLFTVGGFLKNIEDKIFTVGSRALLNPEDYNIAPEEAGKLYSIQENNPETSYVKGVEIDWQTNFWYLPSVLKGIVFNINYTKIFSSTLYPHNRVERIRNPDYKPGEPRYIKINIDESYWDRLQDQPSDIVNLAVGYDYKGFSGRLSMNYSSDIALGSTFEIETRRISDDYLRWDLALNQDLPWDGFQVYCNVTNLSSSIEKTHLASGSKPRTASFYDRGIYFGIRWRTN